MRLSDALLINIGTILASAAFVVPAQVVTATGSAYGAALVWVAAGAISLCGAFAIAELAALFPRAGGEVVYLERAWGPLAGFLYGWSLFAVIQTASIAAVAVICVEYAAEFVALSPPARKAAAVALILALSLWNCRSIRSSARTQNATTVAKLVMAGAIIVLCVFWGDRPAGEIAAARLPVEGGTMARWGAAMVAALWAYDGWISITFVGGEVKNPQRFLPRAIAVSLLALIGIYLLLNLAYFRALPLPAFAGTETVAADAARAVAGPLGSRLVSAAVMVSCFAAANGFIFTGARVYYAMSRSNSLLPLLRTARPRRRPPERDAGAGSLGGGDRPHRRLRPVVHLCGGGLLALLRPGQRRGLRPPPAPAGPPAPVPRLRLSAAAGALHRVLGGPAGEHGGDRPPGRAHRARYRRRRDPALPAVPPVGRRAGSGRRPARLNLRLDPPFRPSLPESA